MFFRVFGCYFNYVSVKRNFLFDQVSLRLVWFFFQVKLIVNLSIYYYRLDENVWGGVDGCFFGYDYSVILVVIEVDENKKYMGVIEYLGF